jgi:HdeA/HdeB family
MTRRSAVAWLVLGLAACVQQPPPPAPAPPPSHVASAPPPDAQIAPRRWDIARVRCSDLLGASDEDRASAAMFYYGYLAARAGIRVIDVSQISGNIAKVMQQCEEIPSLTVPEAFRRALRPLPRRG